MADPYQSQVAPNATPLSGASAESFGAPLARSLEEAAASTDHAIHTRKERDRDNQAAAAGVELANVSAAIDRDAIDARTRAAPGGAGHSDRVATEFDKRSADAIGRIRDPHIRAAFTQRYADLRGHIVGREYGWEAGARVDKLAVDFDQMGTTFANGQSANPDPVGAQVSMATIETAGRHLALPADTQTKLIREQQRKVAAAFANRLVDDNPKALTGDGKTPGLLDREAFNRYLEPEDLAHLRDGAHVEIRRGEAEARQKRNLEETAARETISVFLKRVSAGDLPTDAEFDQATALAKTYDLKGPEFDLGNMRDKVLVNRETRTWTPGQFHDAINTLEAKGDQRSTAENIRLAHLKEIAPAAIGRFNADPFAAAAAGGSPAPALDAADPKSVQARVTWARATAATARLTATPYLSPDELKPLRERAREGPAGQIEVARELRATFGAGIGVEIVRQIDPGNRDLEIMVNLHPRVADLYSRGVEALKAGTVKLGADGEDGQADRDALRGAFDDYRAALPVDLQPAMLNAARAITAGVAAEFNRSQPTGEELERTFRQALQKAGGREGSASDWNAPGGFAEYNGRYAWLPPTMSSNELIRRVSRADGEAWTRAAGGEPYYRGPDGKLVPMTDSQVAHFKEYQLDTVGKGRYMLLSPDGHHVVGRDGQAWVVDVSKLGPSFADQLASHGYIRR